MIEYCVGKSSISVNCFSSLWYVLSRKSFFSDSQITISVWKYLLILIAELKNPMKRFTVSIFAIDAAFICLSYERGELMEEGKFVLNFLQKK